MAPLSSLFLAVLLAAGGALPQEPASPDAAGKTAVKEKGTGIPFEKRVLGGFRVAKDGTGFLVVAGHILVGAIVIHGEVVEPAVFLLDLGRKEACCFDKGFAKKLGILSAGERISLKMGQDVVIDGVDPTLCGCPGCRAFSKHHASVLQGRPVTGRIGLGALAGRRVVLDFSECLMRFLPPEKKKGGEEGNPEEPAGAGPQRIALGRGGTALSLDVVINGRNAPLTFALSTTCGASWVKKSAALAARWRKNRKPSSFLLSGVEMAESLPADFTFRSFGKDEKAPPIDGVLGTDFLSRFVVTLDFAQGTLLLRPIRSFEGPAAAGPGR